jgi:hypothetical protein
MGKRGVFRDVLFFISDILSARIRETYAQLVCVRPSI